MTLLSDSELEAVQAVALSGMTTSVAIYHGAVARTNGGQSFDYPDTPDLTVLGWLREMTPSSATLGIINGSTALAETHRLFLPIGTDCRSGDKVVIDGLSYTCQHTNQGDTYPAALTCYLRLQR